MSENKPLTQKQRYLQFLIPKLDDIQIEKMIAAINSKSVAKPSTITPDDTVNEKDRVKLQTETPGTTVNRKSSTEPNPEKSAEDPYRDMMSMIGCEDAKQQLTAMIADFRMRRLAAARASWTHYIRKSSPRSSATTPSCSSVWSS